MLWVLFREESLFSVREEEQKNPLQNVQSVKDLESKTSVIKSYHKEIKFLYTGLSYS